MFLVLAVAASVAGQSDVDRMITICHDNVKLHEVEYETSLREKRTFADAFYTGDKRELNKVLARDEEFRRFAKARRQLEASWMTTAQKEIMEDVCAAMLVSYWDGRRAQLEDTQIATVAE